MTAISAILLLITFVLLHDGDACDKGRETVVNPKLLECSASEPTPPDSTPEIPIKKG